MTTTGINISSSCTPGRVLPLGRKIVKAFIDVVCGRKVNQPCLLRSELLYVVFRAFDWYGDYKVNLVVKFSCNGDSGHAWLSRNGLPFPAFNKKVDPGRYTLLGETGKYRYYIKESNFQQWIDTDRPDLTGISKIRQTIEIRHS